MSAAPPVVHFGRDVIHQLARRFDLARHARDLEARLLKIGDRNAELDALVRVHHRVLERAARESDRARRRMRARRVEERHRVLEAFRIAAGDDVLLRNPATVEREFERLPAEVADLRNRRTGASFRQLAAGFFDDERAQSFVARFVAGRLDACEQLDVVGAVGERAPVLVAGDDPFVAVEHRTATHSREVRADVRFRQRHSREIFAAWRLCASVRRASRAANRAAPITPPARAMMLATLIQPRASSSAIRQYSNTPSPRPPYSSGVRMPK